MRGLAVMLLLISALGLNGLQAQDADPEYLRKDNLGLSINPVPFIWKEYGVQGEYFHSDYRSLRAELIYQKKHSSEYDWIPIFIYDGVHLRIADVKYKAKSRRRASFKGPAVAVKYLWNMDVFYDPAAFGGSCDGDHYFQSMQAIEIGGAYQWGNKYYYDFFTLEYFLGLGAQFRVRKTTVFAEGEACTPEMISIDPEVSYRYFPFPTLLIGIRLGLTT